MKNKYFYITLIGLLLNFYSCNDDYLEKIPKDQITNDGFWKTNKDFESYAFGLYDFYGYGVGNQGNNIASNSDETCASLQSKNSRIFDLRVIPSSGGGWSWGYLRSCNIMIREAQNSTLEDLDKKHWEGVGRLLRAREYFRKVKSFGDVPWVDHELGTESPELYAPQDSRETVMENVLTDLNFAVQNIKENTMANTINKDVALAIKSEVCLFEGTFRKYHSELNLNDAGRWFNECVSASETLMNGGKYSLSPDFRDIYSSVNLAGNPEVILYKQYETGVIVNIRTRLLGSIASSTPVVSGTKDAIESYLCSDGLPYGISPLHPKAQNGTPEFIHEEFENRDPRLSKTFVVPYDNSSPKQDPALVETDRGVVPPFIPSFYGEGSIVSPTGYHIYKWWTPDSPYDNVNGTLDAPLYTYNKILLNFAEAKAELGEADNATLDKSINLLRERAGMPKLTVELANSFNDPKKAEYAPEISNILWEVRRERRVELMLEGTRLDDILRWKKASYLGKSFVGAYIDLDNRPASAYNEDGTNKASVVLGDRNGNPLPEGTRVGYVLPYYERQPDWNDDDIKLYYSPINTEALTINPNLQQSPGW